METGAAEANLCGPINRYILPDADGLVSTGGIMDMVSAITDLQHAKTLGAVQMRVAKKVMEQQWTQGQAALKLLHAATQGLELAGDSLTAAATGLGGRVDTYG